MGFELVGYSDLRKSLIDAVTELAGREKTHEPKDFVDAYLTGTPDAAKLKEKFSNISSARRSQSGLLLTFIRLLDADKSLDETQKKLVLNAVALHVRDLIELSYSYKKSWSSWAASYFTSTKNSLLYRSLGYALKIDLKNTPSQTEKQNLSEALRDFMMKVIYVNGQDASKGYKPEYKDFSAERINKFDVFKFLKALNNKITAIRNGILKKDSDASAEGVSPAFSGFGLFPATSVTVAASCAKTAQAKVDDFKSSVPLTVF